MAMGKAEVLNECDVHNVLNMIKDGDNPERNRLIFLFSYLVGMRVCNFYKLQFGDVYDPQGKVFDKIVLSPEKNKGKRVAEYYLNDKMKKELLDYYKWAKSVRMRIRDDDYLLWSKKTNSFMCKESIVRIFRRIYDKCGLYKARSHSGRRTFISNLCDKGVAIQIVSKLANHRNVNITMGYYQQSPTLLKNAVNSLKL